MRFSTLTSLSMLLATTTANTPLPDALVQTSMSTTSGLEIAFASRPMWHFGFPSPNKPCYPEPALINNRQHGTDPDIWPNAGTGCADPGLGPKWNSFPTYYTATFCGSDELRVVYSLYFTHDGFKNGGVADGHTHDWERIVVVWSRSNGLWTRKQLLLSTHDGYNLDFWGDIPHTTDYSPPLADGKNQDGAKVYVGWAKHAMFDAPNTAWRDKVSQGCGREFRAGDWWYIPEKSDLVCAGSGCEVGRVIAGLDWGSASSFPSLVEEGVCQVGQGGNMACRYIDSVLPPGDTGALDTARKIL